MGWICDIHTLNDIENYNLKLSPCRMMQNQKPPARPHLPLISHHHHASETCAPTLYELHRLQRNDRDTSAGCAVSPLRTKWARKISWRGCSLTIWQRHATPTDWDDTACRTWQWLAYESLQIQSGKRSLPLSPWEDLDRYDRHRLRGAMFNWDPPFRQESVKW